MVSHELRVNARFQRMSWPDKKSLWIVWLSDELLFDLLSSWNAESLLYHESLLDMLMRRPLNATYDMLNDPNVSLHLKAQAARVGFTPHLESLFGWWIYINTDTKNVNRNAFVCVCWSHVVSSAFLLRQRNSNGASLREHLGGQREDASTHRLINLWHEICAS